MTPNVTSPEKASFGGSLTLSGAPVVFLMAVHSDQFGEKSDVNEKARMVREETLATK